MSEVLRRAVDRQSLVENFDLRDLPTSFYEDPFPTYAALQESDSVHQLPDGGYFLTRYADLKAVYKDPICFSSDKRAAFSPVFGDSLTYQHHTTSLVFNDPPLHTRVRRLIAGALMSRSVAHMEHDLITLVDDLLDRAEQKQTIDAIDDFAAAIPVEVICNLMNIPHSERGPLRAWSLAILSALEPKPTDDMKRVAEQSVADFLDYLKHLIAERRANPLDPETDLLTKLIQGTGVLDGLSETELLHNCIFILNAGHETTTNFVGNGISLLLSKPDARDVLLKHPELMTSALEEILRYESSNQLGNRVTTRPVTLGSVRMATGTQITLCIGAANRDPEQFTEPNRFDISRNPNRHLAFAGGPHICAGMHLARLEGRVGISRFIERFPKAELAGEAVRGHRARFRGFTSFPVRVC